MRLFKQRDVASPTPDAEPAAVEPQPGDRIGDRPCGELGCTAQTGIACAYVDRRHRACPTACCPAHRKVVHRGVYCPVHADTLLSTDWEFATGYHPDLDNRIPSLVATVARALQDDIVAILHRVCSDLGESLLSDAVRFVLVGVDRVRTWERAWKTASPIGVGCRVALCVEERRRDVLIVRVNSKPVIEVPAPWDAIGTAPENPTLQEINTLVMMTLARAVHLWEQTQFAELEAEQVARS